MQKSSSSIRHFYLGFMTYSESEGIQLKLEKVLILFFFSLGYESILDSEFLRDEQWWATNKTLSNINDNKKKYLSISILFSRFVSSSIWYWWRWSGVEREEKFVKVSNF